MPRTPSRCVPVDESVDNLLGALATGCPRPTFSPYSYRISTLLCQFHGGEIVVVVPSPETHLERIGNLHRCPALGKRIARNGCGARCIELLSRRLCHSGGWRGDRRRTPPAAPTRPCGDQESSRQYQASSRREVASPPAPALPSPELDEERLSLRKP